MGLRILCADMIVFTLTNSVYRDEMLHDDISLVLSVKNMNRNIYFTIEMQPNLFLTIFLVPYASTGCIMRERKFDVSASNMIILRQ